MSSRVVERSGHTCGTKQGNVTFIDEETGRISSYCFACSSKTTPTLLAADVQPAKAKTDAEIKAEIAEVGTYQFLDLPERKLRASTLEKFGVRVSVSEQDGKTPQARYFPYTKQGKLAGYKVKSGEYTYSLGDIKGADLFNWEQASKSGAYRLIVTEGEEDACAVDRIYEMYGKEEYLPAIVSLPRGAGCAREALQQHAKEIKLLFKEVIFCFDNDKAGREAVQKAMLVLPNAKSVHLPEKDANDCLLKGKAKAAYTALSFNATKPSNTRIVLAEEIHEQAKEPAKFGELTWPWHQMNEDLRGIRLGETIYLGAGTKVGKTTVKNALGAHFMQEGHKIFMACPEEPNVMTYKLLANQLTGKVFHDPEVEFDEDAYEEAGRIMRGKLSMLNLYQFLGWETLKADITEAATNGCKAVFIDPVTSLINGINSGDANTLLGAFAQELAGMAADMQFTAFIFAHLRAPEGQISEDKRQQYYSKGHYIDLGACSHEMGGSVYSAQFAGSRAMQRSCHLMLALLANKDPDLPEEIRNTRQIRVLEDRAWGGSGKYNLFYNKQTGLFVEL
jgi:twinkle protein